MLLLADRLGHLGVCLFSHLQNANYSKVDLSVCMTVCAAVGVALGVFTLRAIVHDATVHSTLDKDVVDSVGVQAARCIFAFVCMLVSIAVYVYPLRKKCRMQTAAARDGSPETKAEEGGTCPSKSNLHHVYLLAGLGVLTFFLNCEGLYTPVMTAYHNGFSSDAIQNDVGPLEASSGKVSMLKTRSKTSPLKALKAHLVVSQDYGSFTIKNQGGKGKSSIIPTQEDELQSSQQKMDDAAKKKDIEDNNDPSCDNILLYMPDQYEDLSLEAQLQSYTLASMLATFMDKALVLLDAPPADINDFESKSKYGCPSDLQAETDTKTGLSRIIRTPEWLSRKCQVPW